MVGDKVVWRIIEILHHSFSTLNYRAAIAPSDSCSEKSCDLDILPCGEAVGYRYRILSDEVAVVEPVV